MAKKEIIYQGLFDLDVLIEDVSIDSPDYFRVVNLPTEFAAGINIFKFKGRPGLFREDTSVYIEILDSNGEPVYYETALDLESAEQAAIVSVYINEDTSPGNGAIAICSTLRNSLSGIPLDASVINLRWTAPVFIDPSKRNDADIVFSALPEVTVTGGSPGSYINFGYPNNSRTPGIVQGELLYYFVNDAAVIVTSSNSAIGFESSALSAELQLEFSAFTQTTPELIGSVDNSITYTIPITGFSGNGIAFLAEPLSFPIINSNSQYQIATAIIGNATSTINYVRSASIASSTTENSYNVATAFFSGLQPQVGTVAKIRSYYRSTGIAEYILSNETDITEQAPEFGFTPTVVTASFSFPTMHRNDRVDFKFEFVNPAGIVSKQVVESLNNLFLGGNTYIGGDDNLITGSLYVAGQTGTGVHISGKGSAAMIRSIGYTGFQNAINSTGAPGFVIYSGSIDGIVGATEGYTGVGLELVANSDSYFRYKSAAGGLLEVVTDTFFFGNASSYISSSNGNIAIYSANFVLTPEGYVTASAILVERDINGADQIMIDTKRSILDATNLGRTISTNNTLYSAAGNTGGPVNTGIDSVVFQGLQNEFKYSISYQGKIMTTSSTSQYAGLIAQLYYADTGTDPSGLTRFDNWTLIDSLAGTARRITRNSAGTSSKTWSEDSSIKFDISALPESAYQGKLLKIDISSSFNLADAGASAAIKYITITGTRGIGASWNLPNDPVPPSPL